MSTPQFELDLNGGSRALTKADYAYEQMRARILDGRLSPGSQLTNDVIATELGLSATPIREAMRRLAADELITLTAHRDARINPLRRAEAEELYRVRVVLDPMAAELACTHATDAELVVPRAVLGARIKWSDPQQAMLGTREFHRAIYRPCGNAVLVSVLESLWDRADRYRMINVSTPATARQARAEHLAIAEAFESRDGASLRQLMEEHLADGEKKLLRYLDRQEK